MTHKILTGLVFILISTFAAGQNKINSALKHELDSIYQQDQHLRELVSSELLQTKGDSIADSYKIPKSELLNYIVRSIPVIDSLNLLRVDQIIRQYGYPGLSLVGPGTNEAAFFVIQHSSKIDKYLSLIKKAADKKELNFRLYAMMLDRSLMYSGKEQIYGTQGMGINAVNAQTGAKEFRYIIWPIKDPAHVNERRKKAGFRATIEDYAKEELGIDYKALSLEEVNDLKKQN